MGKQSGEISLEEMELGSKQSVKYINTEEDNSETHEIYLPELDSKHITAIKAGFPIYN